MLRTKVKKNTGHSGDAQVRVLKNSLTVHFIATDEVFDVSKEGWDRESGLYNIALEKTNDKIKYVSPVARSEGYLVRFLEFGNRQNNIPEPKKKDGGPRSGIRKDGTPYAYYKPDTWAGITKLEVVEDGIYKGLIIPYSIPYVFVQDPASGFAMLEGTRGENRQVEEFLKVAGGFNAAADDLPFQVNLLPYLESVFQHAGKVFTLKFNDNGFADAIEPLPAFLDVSSILGKSKAKANGKAKSNGKAKKAPVKRKA